MNVGHVSPCPHAVMKMETQAIYFIWSTKQKQLKNAEASNETLKQYNSTQTHTAHKNKLINQITIKTGEKRGVL